MDDDGDRRAHLASQRPHRPPPHDSPDDPRRRARPLDGGDDRAPDPDRRGSRPGKPDPSALTRQPAPSGAPRVASADRSPADRPEPEPLPEPDSRAPPPHAAPHELPAQIPLSLFPSAAAGPPAPLAVAAFPSGSGGAGAGDASRPPCPPGEESGCPGDGPCDSGPACSPQPNDPQAPCAGGAQCLPGPAPDSAGAAAVIAVVAVAGALALAAVAYAGYRWRRRVRARRRVPWDSSDPEKKIRRLSAAERPTSLRDHPPPGFGVPPPGDLRLHADANGRRASERSVERGGRPEPAPDAPFARRPSRTGSSFSACCPPEEVEGGDLSYEEYSRLKTAWASSASGGKVGDDRSSGPPGASSEADGGFRPMPPSRNLEEEADRGGQPGRRTPPAAPPDAPRVLRNGGEHFRIPGLIDTSAARPRARPAPASLAAEEAPVSAEPPSAAPARFTPPRPSEADYRDSRDDFPAARRTSDKLLAARRPFDDYYYDGDDDRARDLKCASRRPEQDDEEERDPFRGALETPKKMGFGVVLRRVGFLLFSFSSFRAADPLFSAFPGPPPRPHSQIPSIPSNLRRSSRFGFFFIFEFFLLTFYFLCAEEFDLVRPFRFLRGIHTWHFRIIFFPSRFFFFCVVESIC
ncbi:MAG: hypothetical protein BJ554DRAFT_7314 [Olpidium bornovanus]|uniref:Uncharacterized protein n=1 Tax=Olpidium bornovanus TaxID=278681 RepID=A0A8H8DJY6_9FUNG|nr:MAG: hypothetical protein BJ554DRAFT_7314 [Olpidium bornovanus]